MGGELFFGLDAIVSANAIFAPGGIFSQVHNRPTTRKCAASVQPKPTHPFHFKRFSRNESTFFRWFRPMTTILPQTAKRSLSLRAQSFGERRVNLTREA